MLIRFNYIYEIKPIDLLSLHEDMQKNIITRFLHLLNWIEKPLILKIIKDSIEINFKGINEKLPLTRTLLMSSEPLEYILDMLGYEYARVLNAINDINLRERLTYLIIDNKGEESRFIRCFMLYRLPSDADIAWISNIAKLCDELIIHIAPMKQELALSKMRRYNTLINAAATKYNSLSYKADISEHTLQALEKHETKLFKVAVTAVINANRKDELDLKSKNFIRNAKQYAAFDAVIGKQKDILDGKYKHLIIELGSMSILYPFVSSEMVELPNGIMLGINMLTGSPVIYDYSLRDNYNIIILAASGYGKSLTAKLILSRMLEKVPDLYAFVIDPQGEYTNIADYISFNVIDIRDDNNESNKLGLDPLRLFKGIDAAEIISDIIMAPLLVRKEIAKVIVENNIDNIFRLYEHLSSNSKKYLADILASNSMIFSGNKSITNRTIISLKNVHSSNMLSTLLLLTLAKVWNEVNVMKKSIPKMILIDEGWMLFNMPSSAKFINLIARLGRKLNVIFIFITQRPEDVIANEYGRALLDNSDTKILLRNNELASIKIAEALQLSNKERDMLVSFTKGDALLLTRSHRLRVHILPTEEELKIFSTTPIDNMV
jgi:hypothetical protein